MVFVHGAWSRRLPFEQHRLGASDEPEHIEAHRPCPLDGVDPCVGAMHYHDTGLPRRLRRKFAHERVEIDEPLRLTHDREAVELSGVNVRPGTQAHHDAVRGVRLAACLDVKVSVARAGESDGVNRAPLMPHPVHERAHPNVEGLLGELLTVHVLASKLRRIAPPLRDVLRLVVDEALAPFGRRPGVSRADQQRAAMVERLAQRVEVIGGAAARAGDDPRVVGLAELLPLLFDLLAELRFVLLHRVGGPGLGLLAAFRARQRLGAGRVKSHLKADRRPQDLIVEELDLLRVIQVDQAVVDGAQVNLHQCEDDVVAREPAPAPRLLVHRRDGAHHRVDPVAAPVQDLHAWLGDAGGVAAPHATAWRWQRARGTGFKSQRLALGLRLQLGVDDPARAEHPSIPLLHDVGELVRQEALAPGGVWTIGTRRDVDRVAVRERDGSPPLHRGIEPDPHPSEV